MKKLFLLFFCLTACLDLYFIWAGISYRVFTKPFCMIFLILYALQHASFLTNPIFYSSMFFAFLGDTFLLGNGSLSFILGLLSFMFMQLGYAYIFFKQKSRWHISHSILLTILVIYIILFNLYIGNYAGDLKIPAFIYSLAIAWMVFAGFFRSIHIPGYNLLVIGVMLFLLSDSLLAINKFAIQITHGGLLVMLSYLLGQFFIVNGYLASISKPSTI